MSIKTNFEIPRGKDPQGIQKQGQRLAQDISSNFKGIKSQLDSISTALGISSSGASSALAAAIAQLTTPIGTIIHSMLTQAEMNTVYGSGIWVIANGDSIVGSAYATLKGVSVSPDLTGVVLRGKNNGGSRNPDGDVPLGSYQIDQFYEHGHINTFYTSIKAYENSGGTSLAPGAGQFLIGANPAVAVHDVTVTDWNGSVTPTTASVSPAGSISTNGGNETRMKNVTVNIFIKIN